MLLANFVHVLFKGFFQMFILGATNRRAGKAIVHLGERCPFWGATNMMAITASVHFGEHCSFWEATNKSAVTTPQNEHMKKAFRKWQFSHKKREQNLLDKLGVVHISRNHG